MKRISFKQGRKCRWNQATGFEIDGQPVHIVGTNYVMRHICTNFWEDWRPDAIAGDLGAIAGGGLNAVRIPVHWEYAEPVPGRFRPEMFERFRAFLEMASNNGLFVMPWFLVGVATRNYDVSWRKGESFFSPRMTECAARHLSEFARRFKECPNILCWDICDEPEWYSHHPDTEQLPYDTGRFHQWVDAMYRAIKEADPDHAVTLGFGHIATGNYGMDIKRAARTLDAMAVTAYSPHMGEDLVHGFRSGWFLGWSVCFNNCAGKGVFTCEAPGWNDIEASERNIAAYYRVCLFSNFANGSHGVMPWVWNDFDDAIQSLPPMDVYTNEKRFGISRADSSLKPAGEELRRFAGFVEEFPPDEWRQAMPEVGVLVPSRAPASVHSEFALLFHHYIALRQAGLRARYVWADDLDRFEGKLLLLPDSEGIPLFTASWLQLEEWVRRGGALVSTSRHVSSIFNALFGVEVEGRLRVEEDVHMQDCRDECAACEGLVLPRGGDYLLAGSEGADVLCRDGLGRPLVMRHALGEGRAFLLSYAPELAVSRLQPEKLALHGFHGFFRAVAKSVGLESPIACPDPRIELDVRRHADGRLLAVAINHSRLPVKTSLTFAASGGRKSVALAGNEVRWIVGK